MKLFSIQKAASILGVSTKTLRRWEEKGILIPHRTPGNQRRYAPEQIDNFKRQQAGEVLETLQPASEKVSISHSQNYLEELVKTIIVFKKMMLGAVFVMFFIVLIGIGFATLKSNNLLKKPDLSKILSFAGILKTQEKPIYSEVSRLTGKAVLGAANLADSLTFGVTVPSEFAQNVEFLNTIKAVGVATLSGGIITEDQDIDAGAGRLTASNVLYGVVAGDGISVGTGQTPTITNTGVLSIGGKSGSLTLEAGGGISVSGLKITNAGVTSLTGTSNQVIVSGSTGSITLSLPQNIHTGASPTFSSLTLSSCTSNGGPLYTNGSGVLAQTTAGTTSQCLLGGTAPSFGSCGTGETGDTFWSQSSGLLFANNSTVDFAIGGQASTSAKFAVLNISSGTPTASLSAGTAGGAYLLSSGTLSTTAQQTLTLGSATTGDVLIQPNGDTGDYFKFQSDATNLTLSTTDGSNLTITPAGTLNLNSTGDMTLDSSTDIILDADGAYVIFKDAGVTFATFTKDTDGDLVIDAAGGNILSSDALNIGGGTANAYNFFASDTSGASTPDGVADLYIQDELEVDGTTRFGNLTYTWPGTETANYALTTNGSGTLSWSDMGVSVGNFWRQTSTGLLYPANSTVDLAIGGTSTTAAKFAVLNISSGTPTASLSAGTAGGAYLNATGTLSTTAKQTLTLGTTTTGDILLGSDATARAITIGSSSKTGLSLTDDSWSITAAGAGVLTTLDTGQGANELYDMDQNVLTSSSPTFAGLTLSGFSSNGGPLITNGSGVLAQVTAGTTGTVLHGNTGAAPSFSAVSLTADVSGVLPIANGGTNKALTLAAGAVAYTDSDSFELTAAGTTNQCLLSAGTGAPTWGNCTFGGDTTNWWTQALGAVYPINSTLDLLIGGTTTASARFAVTGINSGSTPTVTLSAGTAGGAYLNATGTLSTTAKQTLTLGTTTTGDILLGSDATARAITIGSSSKTGLSLTDDSWSITAAGAGVLTTLDTGQGANELYDMDQNVLTSSSPTFA